MKIKLYPKLPVRVVISGPSGCGKTCLLTKLITEIINDYNEIYIYSPSIYQETYSKLIECFEQKIPPKSIPKVLKNNKSIDDIISDEKFEPSDIEISVYENIDELKHPQDYQSESTVIILDDLNENEMKDERVQALFKRSRHNNISVFIISQDYYELPKRTIRANSNVFHLFKPNNIRDVQNLFQDKASMDMIIDEFKLLCNICWQTKFQPLTIDMSKNKEVGNYKLGLDSIFVPKSDPF